MKLYVIVSLIFKTHQTGAVVAITLIIIIQNTVKIKVK